LARIDCAVLSHIVVPCREEMKKVWFELDGRIFVEEECEDGAEGGGEEEEAGDGEGDAGGVCDDAVDCGDAGAGIGEDEAEEGEADPAGDVEAAACGGDGEDDHDGETGERERDDELEVEAARVCSEENEGGKSRWHVCILRRRTRD